MKKAVPVFIFASFTSLVAEAGNDIISPGDPKKEQKQESSFTIAQGYFNLFNIFSVAVPLPADTTKVVAPQPVTTGKK